MQTITNLSAEQRYLVKATFPKLAMRCDTIGDLFYSQLYWSDQSLISMFKKTPKEQGKLLVQMLGRAISCLDDPDALVAVLQELGLRHKGYRVQKRHYKLFGAALISTLELVLGGAVFTPDVKEAWTVFYDMISEIATTAAYGGEGS